MRLVPFILSAVVTTGLVTALNMQLPSGKTKTPKLGYFLSPQYGFWQNAEAVDDPFNGEKLDNKIQGLKGMVDVYYDERLVPHIYADHESDAYFMQGYLHAKYRLWQMEFETYIASGRLSEILGEERLPVDRYFRRMGMVYAAENALKAVEANPDTKLICDAYTAGVNYYINHLKVQDLPFEYKLLDYQPEAWTNLKTALFLKLMSYDLAYGSSDFQYSNAKNYFGYDDFMKIFPDVQDSLDPIIPKGTAFDVPAINAQAPATADSAYLSKPTDVATKDPITPNKNNGSNNWAVGGSKTKTGKPILCNDPHLGLNLPSLWYEMQITTPNTNSYGVSFPGSPAIIIGFNDSIAWGVTNAGRDVKDFYEIKFKDTSMQEYWFDGQWKQTTFRKEVIKVKGGTNKVENIAMTIFGPVMYDKTYTADTAHKKNYALRWKAHDGSNELLTFYKLNAAKGYTDYVTAISTFECPGQNFVFAAKNGDIAIRQQGAFPAKWNMQGKMVMPGTDSSYMWKGIIPVKENPQMVNPERGFVSSANQKAVDDTYPYYLGGAGNFPPYRGLIINRLLNNMTNITPQDMMQLQTDNYNVFAEICKPVMLKYLDETQLNTEEKKYFSLFKSWNLRNDVAEKGATVFRAWWDSIEIQTFADEYAQTAMPMPWPDESMLIDALIKDSAYKFLDNITTKDKTETINEILLKAFKKAVTALTQLEKEDRLEWAKFKDTHVDHWAKLPALSRLHLNIGGGSHIINATTNNHGPSWRMVVHLTDPIEAYVVYPGGQSGNPGSKYYDTFIDAWAAGKYYQAIFIKKQEARRGNQFKWHFTYVNA